ncbi:uncharacterized protein BDZ83DRAFT_621501 [Colletotrichum acutatum]|uniref:Uncharacterized protein n=1 Tax=Glomerella acutata TaxID=27357 RepID=A0AAD8UKE1_GLOAC|nr:uncharacterized protein BDZ83DRAFT_621501 [Colletotrichum acutatum]KAK1724848.1 hypothetical protein BDZ83DRAFT_621501 [Colletotrichum acutatum]
MCTLFVPLCRITRVYLTSLPYFLDLPCLALPKPKCPFSISYETPFTALIRSFRSCLAFFTCTLVHVLSAIDCRRRSRSWKEEQETGHSELMPASPFQKIRYRNGQAMLTPSGAGPHESEEWRGRTRHGHSAPGKSRHRRFRCWCFFLARRKLLLIKVLHLSLPHLGQFRFHAASPALGKVRCHNVPYSKGRYGYLSGYQVIQVLQRFGLSLFVSD